ncbi:hypothetical protein [Phaeocystidibacter luteus]|uniref:DUF4249 family protein n=1 Tax=Phaeocystidibacter luteus TaxID=911197 RepID=A0A6N6RL87_9FLAO|nr:hypothetical protein [Phaeocystidibacter luteus]KAB2814001.1 hypothetical protein F8C67_04790 [Phaeocystidibacter luteus]
MSKLVIYLLIALPGIAQCQVVLYDRMAKEQVSDYVIIIADSISDLTFTQSTSGKRCLFDLAIISCGYHSLRLSKNELLPDTLEMIKMHHDLLEVEVYSEGALREYKSAAKRPRIEFSPDLGQLGYFIPTGDTCKWKTLILHDVKKIETNDSDLTRYRIAWINIQDSLPLTNPDSIFSAQVFYEIDVLAVHDRTGNRSDHILELPQFEFQNFRTAEASYLGIMVLPLDPVELAGGQVGNPLNSVIISPVSLEGNVLSASGMYFGLDYSLMSK